MMTSYPTVRVAACHAAPVFFDAAASTEKYLRLVDEAAAKGANLIVFAEVAIPGFPLFASTAAPVDNEGVWARYVEQSIYADGPEIAAFRDRAREHGVVISLGFSERSRSSVGCIWNSNVVIGEDGNVLAHHRVASLFSYIKRRHGWADQRRRNCNRLSTRSSSGLPATGTGSSSATRKKPVVSAPSSAARILIR